MFILPEESPADLFILYPPGARGDFLASVLKNCLYKDYKKLTISSPSNYQKSHWSWDLGRLPIHRFRTKIRIKLSTIEDYLTVAHLWKIKIQIEPVLDWVDVLDNLFENEKYSIQSNIDKQFDYTIDFADLYNSEFIQEFYQTINNCKMPNNLFKQVQYNISMQPWVELSHAVHKTSNVETYQ